MTPLLVGISYRTAPVEVRERHTLSAEACQEASAALARAAEIDEAAILATCNRTELIASAPDTDAAAARLRAWLGTELGDGSLLPEHVYEIRGSEAVAHLYRVASSLDSMVVGEAQILGQVKQAYRAAERAHSVGPVLHRLFQSAFRCAKRVRAGTGLGGSPVSVARIGVQLAGEIFETFDEKRVVLLGAGEMAESALHGLRDAGARRVAVLNRSADAARSLAERFAGEAFELGALERELRGADIAIASITVREPAISRAALKRVLAHRRGRPLLIVDLGLPRNVEAAAHELDNVYLYDLDDLEQAAERGRQARHAAVEPARKIVDAEVERFDRWLARLGVAPTIKELVERGESLARAEVRRRTPADDPALGAALERVATSVVARLLHGPLSRLRAEAEEGGSAYYSEAVRELFELDEEVEDLDR